MLDYNLNGCAGEHSDKGSARPPIPSRTSFLLMAGSVWNTISRSAER